MFETEDFKKQLTATVSVETAQGGLAQYETAIIDFLQGLAKGLEPILMERELKKTTDRRGIPDALRSAADLVREGAAYAAAEKRTVLQLTDIRKAYEAKYCKVWPFCKG